MKAKYNRKKKRKKRKTQWKAGRGEWGGEREIISGNNESEQLRLKKFPTHDGTDVSCKNQEGGEGKRGEKRRVGKGKESIKPKIANPFSMATACTTRSCMHIHEI